MIIYFTINIKSRKINLEYALKELDSKIELNYFHNHNNFNKIIDSI